jgi:uncharacterized membrane protein
MLYLVLGLVVFLGTHSLRLCGDARRDSLRTRLGEGRFKAAYSLLSVTGLLLVIYGFGLARETPEVLWTPPAGIRHLAFLLTLIAMVLLVAAYVPRNSIRARLHHPMVLSVKVWALAHLVANGTLAHLVLFGGFLLWSVLVFKASRQRDRALVIQYPAGELIPTAITASLGLLLWLVTLGWLHGILIGVRLIS